MSFGRYRVLAQLGTGEDGISYQAQDPADNSIVEIWALSGARSDKHRWKLLSRRLRLVALLNHAQAVPLREFHPDDSIPYVVMGWTESKPLRGEWHSKVPVPEATAIRLTRDLAAALAEAHRLGLVHGNLSLRTVYVNGQDSLITDFSGIDSNSIAARNPPPESCGSDSPPEASNGAIPDPATDVFSLGTIFYWLLTGREYAARKGPSSNQAAQKDGLGPLEDLAPDIAPGLHQVLRRMLHIDPSERPSAKDVQDDLAQELVASAQAAAAATRAFPTAMPGLGLPDIDFTTSEKTVGAADSPLAQNDQTLSPGRQLGRFRLLEKLGEGGMGAVYRGEDVTDGTVVAIKVMQPRWASQPEAMRRFHKEARLLAEVNNPYVANLLEVNHDAGIHYLVLEFVSGKSLGKPLAERKYLSERLALSIMADVARALLDAHQRGIVHRDIKPDNILVVDDEAEFGSPGEPPAATGPPHASNSISSSQPDDSTLLPAWNRAPRVKLSDFGLARHVLESESLNLTRHGALVGTPSYMAPEQCSGGVIDPRTDVYAMGATLFHLLTGRPPFVADEALAVLAMHRNEPAPSVQKFIPALSDGVAQIVAKALAKHPDGRYRDAGAFLLDVERLLRGELSTIAIHPRLPENDLRKVLKYDWSWDLDGSPQQLWPLVSNTERLNRAIGLTAVQFTAQHQPGGGVRRFGRFRKAGLVAAWEEHPFEWVEAQRMGVLREYSQGPFKWLISIVELTPRFGGGSKLTHRVRIQPTGRLGRALAAVEVGIKGRRALDYVYQRIDASLKGKLRESSDPFEEPAPLVAAKRRQLDHLIDKLIENKVDALVAEKLGDFIAQASPQEVARIRPLALANRLGLDSDKVLAACLHGARDGLLLLLWDIMCPVCRISTDVKSTLRLLRDHATCQACNLDFELDFGNSVEMIFRAHPEIRASELGTYCIGGPAHSPHVAAQVRLGPGERMELELALTEGTYQLRGPQLPSAIEFRVQPAATTARWEFRFPHGPRPDSAALKPGWQVLALTNEHDGELLLRVERTASRVDALTAARASSLALFRELFPAEVLSPGQLFGLANVTLLVTSLDQTQDLYEKLGDAQAFGLVHEHFRLMEERIRREGGALVKTMGEGVMAAFTDTAAAIRVGLDLQLLLASNPATCLLKLRVGIHRGPALITTLNDHLDYFGTMVNQAVQLAQLGRGGELVLSQAVVADPQVAALIQAHGIETEIMQLNSLDQSGGLLHRLRIREAPTPEGAA